MFTHDFERLDNEWELRVGENQMVTETNWEQVYDAITQMNGDQNSMVLLNNTATEQSVFAGGGNSGLFIVMFFPDSSGQYGYALTDVGQTGPDVRLTVQTPTTYPSRWCVTLPLVLDVFQKFMINRRVPGTLRWEKDDYSGVVVQL